jgi:lysophospholipase L1-like esterase
MAPHNSLATHNSAQWEKEIGEIEARNAASPLPAGCIIFVGSSSIRRWASLAEDFRGLPVVNHGFGGSQLADSVNFADRIITPYQPRQVVIYAGNNDIGFGKEPDVVFGDFVALVTKIRTGCPNARISYIAVGPCPLRWHLVEKVRRLNRLAEEHCLRNGMDFIDVFPLMLGPDGQPRPDIFAEDRLHMNENGYAIWREAIAPYLR